MHPISGCRVLVTGASGLVALPVAVELARSNGVYAVARFSDPEQKRLIEAASARAIAFDLANPDLSPGSVRLGTRLEIAYYDQLRAALELDTSACVRRAASSR
jgi:nucleoside-diphosphate-sugar epimerase